MGDKIFKTVDGNEAVSMTAYQINEAAVIYPITPSSPMAEWIDLWESQGKKNVWGTQPVVVEMQSEGGAAGALHGALQAGTIATTFTASQGLLLMIPNMYKIAGELTPAVFHVSARTVATHALSIFGDHSDVMAVRQTGFALLGSASVQEAHDFALIAQAASLESRIPFVHFFDGFRTSHEVQKIEVIPVDVINKMIDYKFIEEHRQRALSPDHPTIRGTAQNPDVFFQAREACNSFYDACPDIVQKYMDRFAELEGRKYDLFDYYGAPDADRIIVIMGSGCDPVHETMDYLNSKGEKIGVVKVRLYRPFDQKRFMEALPASTKKIAVLDRTKEPGSTGEPLYLDCVDALYEGLNNGWGALKEHPQIVGGRYGLSSKDFTPAMVKAVFDNLSNEKPKSHFTIGINDDVTHMSLDFDHSFSVENEKVVQAMFYGLGSDGTVGANKNSIKIIGENTPNYAQGYFVYDSKKSGAMTVSHLRFGPDNIRSTYLVTTADFVACHQPVFLGRMDMLKHIKVGGTFLLNAPYGAAEIWQHLPNEMQSQIINKKLKFYVVDAYQVAEDCGMGTRINTAMQVCFFAISGVLPKDQAIESIKTSIKKTYGSKGEDIVQKNMQVVDKTLEHMFEVQVPGNATSKEGNISPVSDQAPEFVKNVIGKIILGDGDDLPVSAMPVDGTFPTATTQWEKRNLALKIPAWDQNICIQCGKCSVVCPHGVIRIKAYDAECLKDAPSTFKSADAKDSSWKGKKFTVQVAVEDCTGCGACVSNCPVKDKNDQTRKAINMSSQLPLREEEMKNWEFFLNIPEMERRGLKVHQIKQQQVQRPLFEFSGACAGCGETAYVKLMSQLFGDRMYIANATGCSSIYGGNLPTTPWAKNDEGRGPTWSNSLFEDNAEFGFGMRLSVDKQKDIAEGLLKQLSGQVGEELVNAIINAEQKEEAQIFDQRDRIKQLKEKLAGIDDINAKRLLGVSDMLVKKSVWILGGDGWAYDIGYGGLDHVIANNRNVNILVLDTEVYSNTGGQMYL